MSCLKELEEQKLEGKSGFVSSTPSFYEGEKTKTQGGRGGLPKVTQQAHAHGHTFKHSFPDFHSGFLPTSVKEIEEKEKSR